MHTCPNKMIYIGITGRDPKKRWASNGFYYKDNKRFSNAIRKYGWINIRHEIIKDNLSQDEAEYFEKKYIQKYNSTNPKKGYNLTFGGIKGVELVNQRRVLRYDYHGNLLGIYKSQKDASEKTGIYKEIISLICLHKQAYDCESCVFRYEGDPFSIDSKKDSNLRKVIYQLDINKNIINQYNSMVEAAKNFTNSDASCIGYAINHNTHTAYGYYWCEVDKYKNFKPQISKYSKKKINKYSLDGEFIETYNSIAEAQRIYGKIDIGSCCKGRNKTAGGFIWKYSDEVENNTLEVV